jgi:hypothetical protein
MNNLSKQMLDDFRIYIDPKCWDEFERDARNGVALRGEITNILDVYSADGKELLERIYQRDYEVGTESGFVLNCAVAGVANLNELVIP